MSTLHVLLPPLAHFAEVPAFMRWLAHGDRLPDIADARDSTLRASFRFAGDTIPAAALRHYAHTDETDRDTWLCADPAYVRSEATGARLMAWPIADLDEGEAVALAADLRPIFDDAGMPLNVDAPTEWCVRLPDHTPQAKFMPPSEALGADLLECLPRGETGRAWRRLFNEAQVALHAHPVNATRHAGGKLTINALWFWGAGALPERVETSLACVVSGDDVLRGLGKLANITCDPPGRASLDACARGNDALLDIDSAVHVDDAGPWLAHFQHSLREHHFDAVVLTFADGTRFRVRHLHRLRFWRRG